MPELPTSPNDSHADFLQARFLAFRSLSIRVGFFIACMPVLSLIPHGFLDAGLTMRMLPIRLIGALLWLAFPLALITGAPRRVLPWILYGSVLSTMLLVLFELGKLPRGSDFAWIALYFFIFPPMLGLPFRRRENVIGILVLLLVPNLVSWIWPDLGLPMLRINIMVLPVAVISLYLQTLFDELLRANHEYRRQVESLAHRDGLTGAYNRRYFMEQSERLLKQAKRADRPLSLLILDIDHFKGINDRFGHGVGDLVIRETARLMGQSLRETDLVARLGGEEFVALLPDSDRNSGLRAAERVRKAMEKTEVVAAGLADAVRFTVSLGLAQVRTEGETLDSLLDRADQALYTAKRSGRNQAVGSE